MVPTLATVAMETTKNTVFWAISRHFSKTTDWIGVKFYMKVFYYKWQLTKQDGTHPSNGCHGNDKKHCFLGHYLPFLKNYWSDRDEILHEALSS